MSLSRRPPRRPPSFGAPDELAPELPRRRFRPAGFGADPGAARAPEARIPDMPPLPSRSRYAQTPRGDDFAPRQPGAAPDQPWPAARSTGPHAGPSAGPSLAPPAGPPPDVEDGWRQGPSPQRPSPQGAWWLDERPVGAGPLAPGADPRIRADPRDLPPASARRPGPPDRPSFDRLAAAQGGAAARHAGYRQDPPFERGFVPPHAAPAPAMARDGMTQGGVASGGAAHFDRTQGDRAPGPADAGDDLARMLAAAQMMAQNRPVGAPRSGRRGGLPSQAGLRGYGMAQGMGMLAATGRRRWPWLLVLPVAAIGWLAVRDLDRIGDFLATTMADARETLASQVSTDGAGTAFAQLRDQMRRAFGGGPEVPESAPATAAASDAGAQIRRDLAVQSGAATPELPATEVIQPVARPAAAPGDGGLEVVLPPPAPAQDRDPNPAQSTEAAPPVPAANPRPALLAEAPLPALKPAPARLAEGRDPAQTPAPTAPLDRFWRYLVEFAGDLESRVERLAQQTVVAERQLFPDLDGREPATATD